MDRVVTKINELREQLEFATYLAAKSDQSEIAHKAAHNEVMRALMILNELKLEYEKIGAGSKRPPADLGSEEINKVTRRLKLWENRQQQINSRILTAYLKLEREGVSPITEHALNKQIGGEVTFATNFLQMRISAERNHGKVFDMNGDIVTLWPPVELAIREYEKAVFNDD